MEKAPLPQRKELLRRINRIGLAHAEALGPREAAERILEEALGASGSDLGFVCEAGTSGAPQVLAPSDFTWAGELTGLCEGGVEAAIEQVVASGSAQVWAASEGAPAPALGCLVGLPLLHEGRAVAVLGLAWSDNRRCEELLELLEPLCAAAATLLLVSADGCARQAGEEGERLIIERLQRLERLESLSCLAGDVAHDMNNILVALLGSVDLVSAGLEGEDLNLALLREDLEQVSAAGQRASALASRLQGFGRRAASELRTVQVGELLKAMAPSLQRITGEGVDLHVEAATPLAGVSIAPSSLEVALWCVVLNAQEALEAGGVIRIEAENRSPDQVALTVSDSGCGMEERELGRAAELFFSTKTQGAGLGLPTVERLLLQVGGRLEVASTPRGGTTVTLLLPACRGDA